MRRIVPAGVILLGVLAQAGSVQAGVYNLNPPRKYRSDYTQTHAPQDPKLLVSYLTELRAIVDPPQSPSQAPPKGSLRESYLQQFAQLETKRKEGSLGVADQVNLSACLIRRGRFAEAHQLLEGWLRQVPRDHPLRVLLLLNLAAAYQEDESLLQRGIEIQREALVSWPALVPGWSREEWTWYRHVEQYTLELMQLRNRERVLRGDRPSREQLTPDKLFPREERDVAKRVQFVGESGEYEAGRIAWTQWERLPADAEPVVLQLLIWRPQDVRLLWLYGELLNARGKVDGAYFVLNDRVRDQDRWRNRELDRHVRVLSEALARASSGAANEIDDAAASANPDSLSGRLTAPESRSGVALPDWRQLAVSFLTGVVVAVLGVLQWQQWRRPRRDDTATSVQTASVSDQSR